MKRYAQLTESGWININEDTFMCAGLQNEKSYAFSFTNPDYAGGGITLVPGIDTPEELIPLFDDPGIHHDDSNGIESFWPEDVASYIAEDLRLYLGEDEDYNQDFVPWVNGFYKLVGENLFASRET